MCSNANGVLMSWLNAERITVPMVARHVVYAGHPMYWDRAECFGILILSTSPIITYYSNFVVDDHARGGRVWPAAASEFNGLELGQLSLGSVRCIDECRYYDGQTRQGD